MKYADMKLREEEQRATKYLESCSGKYQNLYKKKYYADRQSYDIFHNLIPFRQRTESD